MDEQLFAARYGVYRNAEVDQFGIGRKRNGTPHGYLMTRAVRSVLPEPWPLPARFTGAVLGGGDGALLAGDSWLQAFGVVPPRPFASVEVFIAETHRERKSKLAVYQRTRALEAATKKEREHLTFDLASDIGVASPRCAITGLGARYSIAGLRGLLATLVQQGVTCPETVLEWTRLHPRLPGAAVASAAAHDLSSGADSEGEHRFLEVARAVGLPPDRGHVKIFCRGVLLTETDAWWEDGVPGYFDGAQHGDWARRQADNRIRTQLANAGLRPFIATTELNNDPGLFKSSLQARKREASESTVRNWRVSDRGIEI